MCSINTSLNQFKHISKYIELLNLNFMRYFILKKYLTCFKHFYEPIMMKRHDLVFVGILLF